MSDALIPSPASPTEQLLTACRTGAPASHIKALLNAEADMFAEKSTNQIVEELTAGLTERLKSQNIPPAHIERALQELMEKAECVPHMLHGEYERQLGNSALQAAIVTDHTEGLKCLLEHAGNTHSTKLNLDELLLFAVFTGSPESIKILVDAGADINSRDSSGYTPLLNALLGSRPDNARYLLELGADPTIAADMRGYLSFYHRGNQTGDTALHLAAARCPELVPELLNRWANVDVFSQSTIEWDDFPRATEEAKERLGLSVDLDKGYTPLLMAIIGNHEDTAKLLLQHSANPLPENMDLTILCAAITMHMPSLLDLMFEKYIHEDDRKRILLEDDDASLPGTAVLDGDAETLSVLLKHGALPDTIYCGESLLYIAAERGKEDMAKVLLDKGAKHTPSLNTGLSPLGTALINEHTATAKLLISHGCRLINEKECQDLQKLMDRKDLHVYLHENFQDFFKSHHPQAAMLFKNAAPGKDRLYLPEH